MFILRAKRWLEQYEFREILKIADYKGYEKRRGPIFVFNLEKALRNKYTYDDIISLINEYELEIDEASLEELRELFSKTVIRIKWDNTAGKIKIHVPRAIKKKVIYELKELGCRYAGVNEDYVILVLMPYKLGSLKKTIEELGLEYRDEDGLFKHKDLPFNLNLINIKLRPYQEEALKAWIENKYQGIIALPTGSGKTIIGIAAITKVNKRTLIITFTREQMFQWKEAIYKCTNIGPGMIGLIYSNEKRIGPITITTYQSGYRQIKDLAPYFDFLLVDEVHHLPAEKFKYIALHSIATYRMGLSATVVREDGKHTELFPLLGGIVYHKSAAELANQGYLARYRIISVKIKLKPDERKQYEELRKTYQLFAGGRTFNEVLEAAMKGDERARYALRIHNQMKLLLAKSSAKIDEAVKIAQKELARGNKIIIFTQYIEQAKEISSRLGAYLLTGKIPPEKRKRVLREFKDADKGILVVTTVGDEGLDIPDANVGIIVSGTGSRRQFIQRLGRILRPKREGNEARLYEIILEKTSEEYLSRKRKKLDLDEFIG